MFVLTLILLPREMFFFYEPPVVLKTGLKFELQKHIKKVGSTKHYLGEKITLLSHEKVTRRPMFKFTAYFSQNALIQNSRKTSHFVKFREVGVFHFACSRIPQSN